MREYVNGIEPLRVDVKRITDRWLQSYDRYIPIEAAEILQRALWKRKQYLLKEYESPELLTEGSLYYAVNASDMNVYWFKATGTYCRAYRVGDATICYTIRLMGMRYIFTDLEIATEVLGYLKDEKDGNRNGICIT